MPRRTPYLYPYSASYPLFLSKPSHYSIVPIPLNALQAPLRFSVVPYRLIYSMLSHNPRFLLGQRGLSCAQLSTNLTQAYLLPVSFTITYKPPGTLRQETREWGTLRTPIPTTWMSDRPADLATRRRLPEDGVQATKRFSPFDRSEPALPYRQCERQKTMCGASAIKSDDSRCLGKHRVDAGDQIPRQLTEWRNEESP